MKRNLRLIMALLFIATTFSLQAQVAINTDGANPDPSAMLDVKSAAKGVLLSRVADVTAIASPATGLIAYQTSDNQFYYFDGTNWVRIIAEGPMGIVLNGMLDVHGSIKNTSSNNNGEVLVEDVLRTTTDVFLGNDVTVGDDLRVDDELRVDGEIVNDTGNNGGDVLINDDATVDGNLNVTGGIRNLGGATSYVLVDDGMGLRIVNGLDAQNAIENSTGNNFGRVFFDDDVTVAGGLASNNGALTIDDSQGLEVENDLDVQGDIFNSTGFVNIDDDVEITGNLSVNGMILNSDGGGSMLQLDDIHGVTIEANNSDIAMNADDIRMDASGPGGNNIELMASNNITMTAATITVNGAFVNNSDERLKDKIRPIEGAIENIAKLSGYTYVWNGMKKELSSKDTQYGVLAQELEKLYPELVVTDNTGYKAVNYLGLIPVLIEATKEQNEKVNAQQKEIDELKAELQTLKAMMLKQMESNK